METTTIYDLPVAELAAHPDNLRTDLGDLRGLTRSIKEGGVVEPLVVIPLDGGGHRVVAGHRRLAAAVEAEVAAVPCWVRDDLAGADAQVVTMLVENMHRQDLTPAEQAQGFEQLAMLGMSDTKAARVTGVGRSFVKKARAVAADALASDTLAAEPGLNFDQALAIAEIVGGPDGDPADAPRMAELAVNAPGRFEHLLSQVREARADAQRRAERTEELTSQGLTVVDYDEVRAPAAALHELTSSEQPEGEFVPLEPDEHAACPGHAVSLSPWDPDRLVYWCLDPAVNGHRTRWRGPNPTTDGDDEAERELKRAERKKVIANNKAWRSAEPVRREYVRKLLAGKRVPKGTLRYVVTELMDYPEGFGRTGDDEMLGDLTATKTRGYGRQIGANLTERATDVRLPLVLLAQHAADMEGGMGVHTWRNNDRRAARWLAYLAGTGYTLSDIEQHVVDTLTPPDEETKDDESHDPDEPVAPVVNLSNHGERQPTAPVDDEPSTDEGRPEPAA